MPAGGGVISNTASHPANASLENDEAAGNTDPQQFPLALPLERDASSATFVLNTATFNSSESTFGEVPGAEVSKETKIQVQDDLQHEDRLLRQSFLLRITKVLMTYGAPSHRIEADLEFAARYLDIPAQFVHHPSVVVASFGLPVSAVIHGEEN